MDVLTFKNESDVGPDWIAFLWENNKMLPVRFEGETQEKVIAKAEAFWEAECLKAGETVERREKRIEAMRKAREAKKRIENTILSAIR